MKNISYKYLMKISRKNIPQNHLVKYPAKLSRNNISQQYLTKISHKNHLIQRHL